VYSKVLDPRCRHCAAPRNDSDRDEARPAVGRERAEAVFDPDRPDAWALSGHASRRTMRLQADIVNLWESDGDLAGAGQEGHVPGFTGPFATGRYWLVNVPAAAAS
jgi:hypothetical protein